MKAAVIFASMFALSDAACPNACSGHGSCGQYDQCTCYPDYGGADCSERFCPTNWAWVTTNANGDLNADGDVNDITIYDSDHVFTASGLDYIISQNEPKGTWESWPAFANSASVDEGHFYMECSNMGVCDRSLGECQCFEGYTGAGCRRAACPNDCSGHGVCRSMEDLAGTTYTYNLWDKDMSRACECDAGYSGPDCSERKCGYGDDPLTTGQVNEVQWVTIYTDHSIGVNDDDRSFSGYFSLTYTDYNGREWVTDDIAVTPHTTGSTTVADATATALNNLPDDVLSGVTVTQSYAEKVVPGNMDISSNAIAASATSGTTIDLAGTNYMFRCPDATGGTDVIFYTAAGATTMVDHASVAVTALSDADPTTCFEQEHFWSIRLKISFDATPGALTNLQVDVSNVVALAQTNEQRGTDVAYGTVADSIEIATAGTGGVTMQYTHPGTTQTTCDFATDGCGISSGTVTLTAGIVSTLRAGFSIAITCNTATSKALGTFTVATLPTATTITLDEDIPDCTISGTQTVGVLIKSYQIETNADFTDMLSSGDRITVTSFSDTTPQVESVTWDATTGEGWVFLQAEHVGDNSDDETVSDPAAETVELEGAGTTEKEECSGRGLCDRETGICTCFKGYTGWACSTQNALVV